MYENILDPRAFVFYHVSVMRKREELWGREWYEKGETKKVFDFFTHAQTKVPFVGPD